MQALTAMTSRDGRQRRGSVSSHETHDPTQRPEQSARAFGASDIEEAKDTEMGSAAVRIEAESAEQTPSPFGGRSFLDACEGRAQSGDLAISFSVQLRMSDDPEKRRPRAWASALDAEIRRGVPVSPRASMESLSKLAETREHGTRPLPEDHYPFPVAVIVDAVVQEVYTKKQGGGDRRGANQEAIMRDFGTDVCGEYLPGHSGKTNKLACLVLLMTTPQRQEHVREMVASITHCAGRASMTTVPEMFLPRRDQRGERSQRDPTKVQIGNVRAPSAHLAVAAVERAVELLLGCSSAEALFEGSTAFCNKMDGSASQTGAKPFVVVVRANTLALAAQICSAVHGRLLVRHGFGPPVRASWLGAMPVNTVATIDRAALRII